MMCALLIYTVCIFISRSYNTSIIIATRLSTVETFSAVWSKLSGRRIVNLMCGHTITLILTPPDGTWSAPQTDMHSSQYKNYARTYRREIQILCTYVFRLTPI